MLSIYNNKLY